MRLNLNIKSLIRIAFVSLVSFTLTAYLISNAYELFTSKDIDHIQSVVAYDNTEIITYQIKKYHNIYKPSRTFLIDDNDIFLESLRVSNSKQLIKLSPIYSSNFEADVLIRPTIGNTIYLNEEMNRGENSKIVMVLMDENWRFKQSISQLAIGSNIFVYSTTGDQYIFRLKEFKTLESGEQMNFPGDDKRNLDLVLIISGKNRNMVYISSLISTIPR